MDIYILIILTLSLAVVGPTGYLLNDNLYKIIFVEWDETEAEEASEDSEEVKEESIKKRNRKRSSNTKENSSDVDLNTMYGNGFDDHENISVKDILEVAND